MLDCERDVQEAVKILKELDDLIGWLYNQPYEKDKQKKMVGTIAFDKARAFIKKHPRTKRAKK